MLTLKQADQRIFLLFVLGLGLFYSLALNPAIDAGGDSANYILLGRALIEGRGYVDLYPAIPQPHTIYPPVFPVMLSVLMIFFGENFFVLKFIPLLSMLAAVYVLARLVKDDSRHRNLWAVILFALNPLIFYLSVTLMSEAAYLLFSFLSLLMLGKYAKKAGLLDKYLWLTLGFMLLSFYTRSIGLVLFPAALGFLLHKRDFKKAGILSILYLIGISPWIFRGILLGSGYMAFLFRQHSDEGSVRFIHNISVHGAKVIADTFFYPYFFDIARGHVLFVFKAILSLFLSVSIIYGYIIRLRREIKPFDVYAPLIFIACLFWPVHGPRFMAPVLGFLIFYFLCAVKSIAKGKRAPVVWVACIILIPSLMADAAYIYKASTDPYEQQDKSYLDACAWLKNNTSAGSLIMCRKPRLTFLITGRRAMYYPGITDPEKMIDIMQEKSIDYVIADTLGKKDEKFGMWTADRFLMPVIRQYPERFLCVYPSKGGDESRVYRVLY